jgi:hypothetical protein
VHNYKTWYQSNKRISVGLDLTRSIEYKSIIGERSVNRKRQDSNLGMQYRRTVAEWATLPRWFPGRSDKQCLGR